MSSSTRRLIALIGTGGLVLLLWIDHLGGVEAVIVSPDLRGVADGTYPEGDQSLTTGGYFSWEDVWIG